MGADGKYVKVLFFAPYAINTPHFETELELMEDHLLKGDDVSLVHCLATLSACDVNPSHNAAECLQCIGRRIGGTALLHSRVTTISLLNLTSENLREAQGLRTTFHDVADLKSYKIDNFDLGYGVASSVISLTRSDVNFTAQARLIKRYVQSAFVVFRSVQNLLDTHKPDLVYVFNGRYACLRAVVRACQSRSVRFCCHERGHTLQHYSLYHNTWPHDPVSMHARIIDAWNHQPDENLRRRIAEDFYLERERGERCSAWFSFVAEQKKGLLPPDWSPERKNIVAFTSSEDEFAAIDDSFASPLYQNQVTGLKRILEELESWEGQLDPHLYVRIHPNLKNVRSQVEPTLALTSRRLTVIPPESQISTYALMKNADVVLTFGSTTGIEATFWGKPSILAGVSFYRDLGATYNPSSHEELIEFLKVPLKPKDQLAALKYGYYLNTFGLPFKHFEASGVFSGQFKKRPVRPHWLHAGLLKLCRYSGRFNWLCQHALMWWTNRLYKQIRNYEFDT